MFEFINEFMQLHIHIRRKNVVTSVNFKVK